MTLAPTSFTPMTIIAVVASLKIVPSGWLPTFRCFRY